MLQPPHGITEMPIILCWVAIRLGRFVLLTLGPFVASGPVPLTNSSGIDSEGGRPWNCPCGWYGTGWALGGEMGWALIRSR